jgi:hypothetical protein
MRSRTSSGVNHAASLASAVGPGVPLMTRQRKTRAMMPVWTGGFA